MGKSMVMILEQFNSIDALKEAIITGSCTDQDLLDWEYGGKISEWLDSIEEEVCARILKEEYSKEMGDEEQFAIILKALLFSMEEIEKLTHGQPIHNPYAKQVDTLESLSLKVVELQKLCRQMSNCTIPLGSISLFAANHIPAGWLPCEGQSVSKEFFKSLYLRLGDTWKGVNSDMFALPDLSARNINSDLRYCIFTGVLEKVPENGILLGNKVIIVNGVPIKLICVAGGPNLSTYYIGQYPVTQGLWKAVMGANNNPSNFKGDTLPVETVSWDECRKEFIPKLNGLTGGGFRLPTEAEWEFAARGGLKSKGCAYAGSDSLDRVGWYDKNSGLQTHPVGDKDPNELGIYDMSGNVWEWCEDWYDTDCSSRVARGGGWCHSVGHCTVSYRFNNSPGLLRNFLGFRLALACSSK